MSPLASLAGLVRRPSAWLRSLVAGGRGDAETRDELRFHLEMETEKNLRAGMDPGEARRRARVRLGGADAIREAVRDARGWRRLDDLVRDVGYALRGLRRHPGFTLAAVVSLAIPIGFNTVAFTIVDSILFGPLPVVRPTQLVDVYTSHPQFGQHAPNSYPDYLDLRAANDVFTDMAAHAPMRAVVRVGEDVDLVMGEAVTGNYFRFLGVQPVHGRLLAPDDERPAAARVAVISAGLWERAFGRDPAVVGRDLHIGSQPYVVVGVASPDFYGMPPIPGGDLWIPITRVDDVTPAGPSMHSPSPGETRLERRGLRWIFIKERLRDGVGPARADANLDTIMAGLADAFPDSNESLQGRSFTAADTPESPRVAVVSQAMALRFWPAGTAVGRRFRLDGWDGQEVEVVGVSADYEVNAPDEDPAAYVHLAASQQFVWPVTLLARTAGDARALAGGIRRELRRIEPDLLFPNQGDTLRETAAVRLRPNRIAASLVVASGLVALLLGAVGLYGVVAYLVARRSREFAIRAALGARPGALLRLVLATGGWVVAFGVGSGAVLTSVATRVAASLTPDGMPPPDPAAWAGALLLIAAVAAAAHIGPARRVVRLDLTRTLHAD